MESKTRSVPADFNEETVEKSLRPRSFQDFIGQQKIKDHLKVYIEASKIRSSPLDHVLLSGPPGLGKTTLSQVIAYEMQAKSIATSGPLLEKMGDLVAILTNLEQDSVLFIDEIHRMNRQIEEVLYGAMEDFKVDILIGQGPSARSVKIDLPKFTLIGATTRPGMLSGPLRDRFGIPLRVDFYEVDDLKNILQKASENFYLSALSDESALAIAKRARGTPRIALRYLRRAHDFSLVSKEKALTLKTIERTLAELGVDAEGLELADRKYLHSLHSLYNGGPVGLNTLTATLAEDKDYLEEATEPYLLKIGFIQKTSRGRMLTEKAVHYLESQSFTLRSGS